MASGKRSKRVLDREFRVKHQSTTQTLNLIKYNKPPMNIIIDTASDDLSLSSTDNSKTRGNKVINQFLENLVSIQTIPPGVTFGVSVDSYMVRQKNLIKCLNFPWVMKKCSDQILERGLVVFEGLCIEGWMLLVFLGFLGVIMKLRDCVRLLKRVFFWFCSF